MVEPSCKIQSYMHCKKCLEELPLGESPATWARLSVGWTTKGLQVWCTRHNKQVVALDFMGNKVRYA